MPPAEQGTRGHAAPGSGGHEATDVNARAIVLFLLGLSIVAVVIQIGLAVLFGYLERRESRRERALGQAPAVAPAVPLPSPQPPLQVNPRNDLAALRAEEDLLLGEYAWIDRDLGLVRIPIARAIEIVAERGLPTRPGGDSLVAEDARALPEDARSGRSAQEAP